MTIDIPGTDSLAYPIVVLRRLTEDDFLSIPDESDENLESDREEVENETRMIITKELIFDRLGEILQEKLESTGKWLSCDEFFNRDGSIVSKYTSVNWRDSSFIPRFCKIFKFSKTFSFTLMRV